ncbi:MAG: pyrrolo-quinoline quinone, partial [Planctomycetes bacterium]|nr:pyrrolo-quinoline quinone [Planctomycetota bacterium]
MLKTAASILLVLMAVSPACGENWPHWRGPYYNGSTTETDLPADWSTTENIRWSVELPGPSAATPIIWDRAVFISSTDPDANLLKASCFDRNDGALLWQHDVSPGYRRDPRSTFSAPSPVTDGNVVVFFYSNGAMAGFDLQGNPLWKRNIEDDYGEFAFQWTFSSSPLLFGGKLYLQVL